MSKRIVLVWDCGSTNVRAIAIDGTGHIHAQAQTPNAPIVQDDSPPDWRIWDTDKIFTDLCRLTRQVVGQIDRDRLAALTITTWGADGTCLDRGGRPTYPLISWQCSRTGSLVDRIKEKMDPHEILRRTGYQVLSFNTLLKILWLRENAPDAWAKMHKFVMIPGILTHRLTGEFSVDPTMAGTTMAFDISRRRWDSTMLALAGVDETIWPDLYEPGQIIGRILGGAVEQTGLPADLPVTAAGHDTQFALYGSGASLDQAVLSSGTWEILMMRTRPFEPDRKTYESGILIEQDAAADLVDPQFLMMASGGLEWLRRSFWSAEREDNIYETMTAEANAVGVGADGVAFLPSFVAETGPAARYGTPGSIVGLQVTTTRGQIVRAALEGLSMQLRHALDVFSQTLPRRAKGICIVGGGSKNPLWNQIRADVTGLPVVVTDHKEATVLGAAMFALVGVGEFDSIDQAQEAIEVGKHIIEPGPDRPAYEELYGRYLKLIKSVGAAYQDRSS